MKKNLSVFKIGGAVIDDIRQLEIFLQGFAAVASKKILVHGGGKSVSSMSGRLGLEVKMIDGRRITDEETLEVVKMMLPGVANKTIVAMLQKYGCDALGFTGADGDMKWPSLQFARYGLEMALIYDRLYANAAAYAVATQKGFTFYVPESVPYFPFPGVGYNPYGLSNVVKIDDPEKTLTVEFTDGEVW